MSPGEFLTPELALGLGRAAALTSPVDEPQVLIISDTRESGQMLEAALAAGVAAAGGHALLGGVLPTPGAALLTRRYRFDLAAVVSASHNPYRDNGIKFFGSEGTKLSDRREAEIEAALERGGGHGGGRSRPRSRASRRLAATTCASSSFATPSSTCPGPPCCSTAPTARPSGSHPRSSAASARRSTRMAVEPDGRNINDGVGSTHIERLAENVAAGGYDVGFAFDGDGDRVLAVDRAGVVVDGDELIAIAALHLREHDGLPGGGVAVTVMTNYGFHRAMADNGITVATTPVGDRYVLQELLERGWALGGEQSGHVIDTGFVPSGDGIATALLTLEALGRRDLAERDAMEKLPQRLVNVTIADRSALRHADAVWAAVEREGGALEGRGRVLVRPSGTEPLVRVMVEAPDPAECEQVADRLVQVVKRELA